MFNPLKALLKPPPKPTHVTPKWSHLSTSHAYVCMAMTCLEAIHLITDITSMETAQAAITELVRRGMHLEAMDWILVEQHHHGKPIPTLCQLQAAFRERLVTLGFTSVTQAAAA